MHGVQKRGTVVYKLELLMYYTLYVFLTIIIIIIIIITAIVVVVVVIFQLRQEAIIKHALNGLS